jgi:hypothetical protein
MNIIPGCRGSKRKQAKRILTPAAKPSGDTVLPNPQHKRSSSLDLPRQPVLKKCTYPHRVPLQSDY